MDFMNLALLQPPGLFLLIFFAGGTTLLAARKKGKLVSLRGWSEFLFLSFLTGFILVSLLGLILAYTGFFSVFWMAVPLLIYSVLILAFFRPTLKISFPAGEGKGAALILLFILVLAGLLFFRPAEYIFGGWDPGVYANTAVHLARKGSIEVKDEILSLVPPGKEEAFTSRHTSGYREKYPGFRLGDERGSLIPQFYHLYPVWLAVFYSGGGLRGIFYLTPVLGILSLLAVYLAARELWDRRVALVGVFLITINVVQIWQSRFPTSEMLGQFLFFSGIFVFSRFLKNGESGFAWLGGMILGGFILSRISASLLILPLLIFFYVRWFIHFRKEDLPFWIGLAVLTAVSLLPHVFFGPQYLYSVFSDLVLPGASGKVILVLAGAAAVGARILPLRLRHRLLGFFSHKLWRWLAAGLVLGLLWYGYFIRPYTGSFNPDKLNLVELGWLLTPLGLFLATASVILMILKNRKAGVWLFLLFLAAFSGIFLWQQLIHYYYMWAARRYAVVVVPGFLLLASAMIVALSRSRVIRGRWPALLLFLLLAVHSAYGSRILWNHKEYRGAIDFAQTLSGKLKGADLVVVRGDFVDKIPTFLDLIYGCRVFPLYRDGEENWTEIYRLGEEIARSQSGPSGALRPVIYLLDSENPGTRAGFRFQPVDELPFHSLLLERSWDHLPDKIEDNARDANFTVKIYRVRLLDG